MLAAGDPYFGRSILKEVDADRLDKNMAPSDPYQAFQDWWGEPLDESLLRRAIRAPRGQQLKFLRFAHDYPASVLPELGSGRIRPFIAFNRLHTNFELDRYFGAVLALLLYAHEVVVEYTFGHPSHDGLHQFREALPRLLQLKPLADAGALHFLRVDYGRAYHPMNMGTHWAGVGEEDIPANAEERFAASIDTLDVLDEHYTYETARFHLQICVGVALNLATRWSSRLQPLAQSDAEQLLYEIAFGRARSMSVDLRSVQLRKLAALTVPDYSLAIPGLVALRQSSESFWAWRQGLSNALNHVAHLPDSGRDWVKEAREIVAAELMPLREKLENETRRSTVLGAARSGGRSLALSAFGAAAGALAGGDLLTAVVGAGAGKTSELIVGYIEAAKARRGTNAVLDMLMTFTHHRRPK
jgi:hypothetical protein